MGNEKKEKLVKIKILKHVGEYFPGQEVEVDEAIAKQLTSVGHVNFGAIPVEYVRAVRLEDYKKIEAKENDIENISAAEADAKGIKNIVDTKAKKEADKLLE